MNKTGFQTIVMFWTYVQSFGIWGLWADVREEATGMNFIIAARAFGRILLAVGRNTRLAGIGASVTGIIAGIVGFILISREITRNKEKKQRMTKRINVVITHRERKYIGHSQYRYIYTFTGLDEYEGVTFYDESLLLMKVHVKGEIVPLLINEYNLKEFWFEEKAELGQELLLIPIIAIFLSFMNLINTIVIWDRLPWN